MRPGPRSSSSASGGTSRSRGETRATRGEPTRERRGEAPDAAARTGDVSRGVSDAGAGAAPSGRSEGGPPPSPEATMSNTSFARDSNYSPRVRVNRGRRGGRHAARETRAGGSTRAEHRARSPTRPLAPRARAHARRSSAARASGPGAFARAIAELTRFPTNARAVGRISRSDTHADRVRVVPSRPPRGLSPTRGATRRRARTRTHGMSLLTRSLLPDDASRRARARRGARPTASASRKRRKNKEGRSTAPAETETETATVSVSTRPRPPPPTPTPPARPLPASSPPNPSSPSLARLSSTRATAPPRMLAIGVTAREATHLPATRSRPPSPTGPPTSHSSPAFIPPSDPTISRPTSPSPSPPPPPSPPHAPRFSARGPTRASGGSIQPTGAHPAQQRRRRHGPVSFRPSRRRRPARALQVARSTVRPGRRGDGGGVRGVTRAAANLGLCAGWAAGWGVCHCQRGCAEGPLRPCWRTDCSSSASAAMWLEGDKGERAWCDVAR